ncbi:MAG: tyrosine-type recombinase/integrase [Chloroflexota bacterium]
MTTAIIDFQQAANRHRPAAKSPASALQAIAASPARAVFSAAETPAENRQLPFLIDRYLAHHRRDNRSPKTVAWHSQSLAAFLRFFQKEDWRIDLDDDPKTILAHARAWLEDLYTRPNCWGRPFSADSLSTRVRSVRAFFSWLSDEDYTPFHYLAKLEKPVLGKKQPKALADSQLEQLLQVPQLQPTSYLGVRNLAIVLVYLDTWCRLHEVMALAMTDVHLQDGWVKVLGKGNREAIVHLSPQTVDVLTRYIDQWRPVPTRGQAHLFLQENGCNLSPRGVQSLLARIRAATGLPISAHRLRHTGATAGARKGMSLEKIQAKLRHTTPKATIGYIGLAAELDEHQSGLDCLNIDIKLPRKSRKGAPGRAIG